MKIALVSCSSMSEYKTALPNEDELLLDFLIQKNIQAEIVVWDDDTLNWEAYDLVIIKSTWDYFDKPVAFRAWLTEMKRKEIRLLNSTDIISWNIDKIYLKDFEKANIPTIPTIWLNKGSSIDLKTVMTELNADHIIIKPRISGASKNTFKITTQNIHETGTIINQLVQHEDFMAQPFMNEILEGEYSFVFFNNNLSHTVKKTPQKDDFRVQHYFGGSITPYIPNSALKVQAQNVANLFAKDCLYARVDGIIRNNQLYIIELEVIEPMLYLYFCKDSFEHFFNSIMSRVEQVAILN